MWIHSSEEEEIDAYIFAIEKKEDETDRELREVTEEFGKMVSQCTFEAERQEDFT